MKRPSYNELVETLKNVESFLNEDIGNSLTGDDMASMGIYDKINEVKEIIQSTEK